MRWTYAFKNKITASLLLLVVVGLVIAGNILQRSNSDTVNKSIETIYGDRLIVEGYIYQYAGHLHNIIETAEEEALPELNKKVDLQRELQRMEVINVAYAKTRLTKEESLQFNRFLELGTVLSYDINKEDYQGVESHSREALEILNTLSSIQISEGKSELARAERIFSSTKIFSAFETGLLIILMLIIQAMLFASKTMQTKKENLTSMN